ncbi:hypothetical protein pb186bvf_005406 [Paramecium bursaria]
MQESPKYFKVLKKLGLTKEDLEMPEIQVPEEFQMEADYYKQVYMQQWERRRQRLQEEINHEMEVFQEKEIQVSTWASDDKYLEKLKNLHNKEIKRLEQSQILLQQIESKRKEKLEKLVKQNKILEQIKLERKEKRAQSEQQRKLKLENLEQRRQLERSNLIDKINQNDLKWEQRRAQQNSDRAILIGINEAKKNDKFQRFAINRQSHEQLQDELFSQRRVSYQEKLQKISNERRQSKSFTDEKQLKVRHRYMELEQDQKLQNKQKIRQIDISISQAKERKQKIIDDRRKYYIIKQIKLDEALFNQRRQNRMNDYKKERILTKMTNIDDKVEQFKNTQDQIRRQREKIKKDLEKQKSVLISELQHKLITPKTTEPQSTEHKKVRLKELDKQCVTFGAEFKFEKIKKPQFMKQASQRFQTLCQFHCSKIVEKIQNADLAQEISIDQEIRDHYLKVNTYFLNNNFLYLFE